MILVAGCTGKNDNNEPVHTVTPTKDTGNSSGDAMSSDQELRYLPSGSDSKSTELIKSGKINKFFNENEFVYSSVTGDINNDGNDDAALVIGDSSKWNESLSDYIGTEDDFFTLRVLLADSKGEYRLAAETNEAARISVKLGDLRFLEMSVNQDGLSVFNESISGSGLIETFVFGYSTGTSKLMLNKYITKGGAEDDPLTSFYIVDNEENFGSVPMDGFKLANIDSDRIYDLITKTDSAGNFSVKKIYPDFKIYDKILEQKIVSLVEEDFEFGIIALRNRNLNEDVTITCKKLYQDKNILSFLFVISDSSGKELSYYSSNIDTGSLIRVSAVELYSRSKTEALLASQESQKEAIGLPNLYTTLNSALISAALDNIDKREAIGAESSAFTLFGEKDPKIVVSALNKDVINLDFGTATGSTSDGITIGPLGQVTVYNATQLVSALSSDRDIKLMPGIYNLSEVSRDTKLSNGVSWENVNDGRGLKLSGIKNLRLEGIGSSVAEIVSESGYADVIFFSNCSDISISNLKLGHKLKSGVCFGAVTKFDGCSNVKIATTTFSGSGTMGIDAENTSKMSVSSSIIENCSEAIMSLSGVTDSTFRQTTFRNNRGSDMFVIEGCSSIVFDYCDIKNNSSSGGEHMFFDVSSSSGITFSNSSVTDNFGLQSQSRLKNVTFKAMNTRGNTFMIEFPYQADDIGSNDMAMGIINIGITKSELTDALASPVSTRASFGPRDSVVFDTVYEYVSLDIALYNDRVYAMKTSDANMKTKRGIKVGDTVEAVYHKYGYVDIKDGTLSYPYDDKGGSLSLKMYVYFIITNGKVSEFGIRP